MSLHFHSGDGDAHEADMGGLWIHADGGFEENSLRVAECDGFRRCAISDVDSCSWSDFCLLNAPSS